MAFRGTPVRAPFPGKQAGETTSTATGDEPQQVGEDDRSCRKGFYQGAPQGRLFDPVVRYVRDRRQLIKGEKSCGRKSPG